MKNISIKIANIFEQRAMMLTNY